MNIEENKYRNKITYISFLLSLIVVVRHTVNIEVYNLQGGILWCIESFFRSVSEVAVPTFFVISGYLFFVNFKYDKIFLKWKTRFFSIVIPYLIWNVVAYMYYQAIVLIPFISNNINQSVEEFSLKMLLLNALFGYHNITWFLRNLIIYIFITPIIFFLLKYKWSLIIMLPLIFGLGIIEQNYCYYWFYYLTGAYIGIHFSNIIKEMTFSRHCMIVSGMIFIIASIIDMKYPVDKPNRIIILISIVCLWIMLDVLRKEKEPLWWMRLSFFIYCTHSMILESVEKLILIFLRNNIWGAAIDFICAPIITILIITLLAYFLRKIPMIWMILNGNRI